MTHHRYRVLLLVLCCPLLWTANADAAIASTLKTATPITQSGTQTITASIAGETAKLTAEFAKGAAKDSTIIAQARKALIDDADTSTSAGAAPTATPAYHKVYATSIIAAMTPLLQNPATRLNAAVILGGVAAKAARTNSADSFEPIAKVMMADKEWPIALWGVKIAHYALSDALLNGNAQTTLAADIVKAAQANDKSDSIVEEAYRALVLNDIRDNPAYGDCLAKTLNVMLDLIVSRTAIYQNGGTPVAPGAESGPANTLPIDGFTMLSAPANAALKKRTLSVLGDLAKAQLGVIVNAAGSSDPTLVDAVERLGGAMSGFGLKLPDAPLAAAGTAITKMGANPQPATATRCLNDLTNALTPLLAAAH